MIDARSSHGVHVEIERSPDPESFGAGTVTVIQRTNFPPLFTSVIAFDLNCRHEGPTLPVLAFSVEGSVTVFQVASAPGLL